ncbi:MAG: hypothetical protein EP347_04950 [Alphaproteobacteria bacterium]|nr:MAG: hypothetical protein EP347_04950 [Alphaproteobacteria bacterium]
MQTIQLPQAASHPKRSSTRMLVATLLPLLAACTTTGSVYTGRTVQSPATPDLGPQQYAAVEVPARMTIIGRGASYLTGLLGEPSLKRTEAGAELWQYQSSSCVALFYLYEEEGAMKVSYYDARPRTDRYGDISEELCMKEIVGTFGQTRRS